MLPYYLVLDFEANCSGSNMKDHEIIEFPCILIDSKTGKTISEFRSFVQLVNFTNLSDFIKDLTHITDDEVKNGLPWVDCLKAFETWLNDNKITADNATIVCCGSWDLKTMLPRQLEITKTGLTPELDALFGKWHNVKISFLKHYKNEKQSGMDKMLEFLKIELTGHHHSGIDDCRNIAKICHALTQQGVDVTKPNKMRENKFMHYVHNLLYKRNKKGSIVKQ